MKTARNSLCTCGSGIKYKQCCGLKEGKTSPTMIIVAVLIGVMIVAGAIFASKNSNEPPATAGAPADPNAAGSPQTAGSPQPPGVPGSPQPPGPVPEGKVWNTEHGHWHDAAGATPASGAPAQPGAPQPALTPGPQPPGPVPAGKVWSTEHGHWHDAPKQ
jgi:SEC-C motif-containing protein